MQQNLNKRSIDESMHRLFIQNPPAENFFVQKFLNFPYYRNGNVWKLLKFLLDNMNVLQGLGSQPKEKLAEIVRIFGIEKRLK